MSRAQAFEEMRKKYPELVENLASNPLAAHIDVQLENGAATTPLMAQYAAMRLRDVEWVRRPPVGRTTC